MQSNRSTLVTVALIALFLGLGACATVPLASLQEDARIKALAPPPNAALVYVYRNESFGAAVRMNVFLDGAYAGNTAAKTYLIWQVAPGHHRIASQAENDTVLDLVADPGRTYFVWQEVRMGVLSARSSLHLVPDNDGRAGVRECHLIAMPLANAH